MTSIRFVWCKMSNWLAVVAVAVLLKYPQQAQGWIRVQEFGKPLVLSVPEGHYLELVFEMRASYWLRLTCLGGQYFEIRDGNNQSANLLGVFCGDHRTGVVRSSGQYMWLEFFPFNKYLFTADYIGRSLNETGMDFCSCIFKHSVVISRSR